MVRKFDRCLRLLLPAAALALMASPAAAQSVAADGRTSYDVAYFQQYGPSTALDIVQRVPGFTLQSGDSDVRGFGQSAGNLVINGQRPSSKSDDLQTILSRIPASRVLRIEIGSGDLFGSDYAGKPQVVNLVLNDDGGLAATIDATISRNFTGHLNPAGSVSALYRTGDSTFNLSLGYNGFFQVEEGFDRLVALPSRAEIEFRRKINRIEDRNPFLSGSWALAGGDNQTANVNFRVARRHFTLFQTNDVYPVDGVVRDDRLAQNNRARAYELGGDITRPLLGGGIKLVALATHRPSRNSDVVQNRIRGQVIGGFTQDQRNTADERVVRLVWSRSGLGGWSLETGIEGAFNRLQSNADLFALDGTGGRTRIDLPVDQAVVSERRGEAFVNAGRSLSSNLRMDLGLTYEASRLTVSGDATAERSLRFWKPRATFDWRPGGGWHTQLSVSRTVAQLDFEDFTGAAELTNDRVNGGNAELLPQRAWEALATIDRPILGDGLAKVELGYNRISLLQDRVPTPEGFDAPGNLGTGTQRFARLTLDAPLTRLGIAGGRLTINGTLQDTSVRDPYTGLHRRFSGTNNWQLQAQFRQDLGSFAWGVGLFGNPLGRVFRQSEIDSFNGIDPYITAFAEYRPTRRTTFTLTLDNVSDVPFTRRRLFFTPDRTNPTPGVEEFRQRQAHARIVLNAKLNLG